MRRYGSSSDLSNEQVQSRSSLLVQINTPPSGTTAMFTLSPANGTAFVTVFTWSAEWFEDDDLPLTYQFGYTLQSISTDIDTDVPSNTVLRSRITKSYTTAVLPPGLYSRSNELTSIGQIFDSMDAFVVRSFPAVVLEPVLTVAERDQLVDSFLDILCSLASDIPCQ